MREILFRGKTENDKWVYGSLIVAGDYCCILELEENVHPMNYPYLDEDLGTIDGKATPVIPETVGQFTGLFDKNGKKIFEGDIVRYYGDLYTKIFSIVFAYGCFRLGTKNGYVCTLHNLCSSLEVIGNIYDDPELLEVK